MKQLPVALRWALVGLIAVLALAVALWPRDEDGEAEPQRRVQQTSQVSEELRAAAGLTPCPRPAPGAVAGGPLAGLTVSCLADGAPLELAAALAGKPALLNLWAYWCGPCREELPDLQRYAERAGSALTVLTVHSDPQTAAALTMLTELHVTLPGVLDPDAKLRTTVGAPAVLPVSVLLRADGSVAEVVVRRFTDVEDIADTVAARLGVRA
ncbi:TlpA family protein disulfide reductase [Nocardia sp. NPDC127579]|uniref:TlpA family protein disulfide reductase n=1 Tax=Nocardia sp. NPDC127579 TaxID=3345402 RepID=UPI00363A68C5